MPRPRPQPARHRPGPPFPASASRPGRSIQARATRLAPPFPRQARGALQAARENLDGEPLECSVGGSLGSWTLSFCGGGADVWNHSSGKWKASYYRVSGDYHIKGLSGVRRGYEKGTFGGSFRSTGRGNYEDERDDVYASFQDDVIDSISSYSR